jgi:hypothetical protein
MFQSKRDAQEERPARQKSDSGAAAASWSLHCATAYCNDVEGGGGGVKIVNSKTHTNANIRTQYNPEKIE